jgi:GNAT superfamily N-acetyltransferase
VAPCRTPAEVEVFERTSVEAFTGSLSSWRPGAVHPPASLGVPGLTLLLASLDGQPVGTAIAATDGTVLYVAGVAVLKSARRQGVGTAVTAACLATAPTLPAVLSSSEDGHTVYRSLSFTDAGPTTLWWRPAA